MPCGWNMKSCVFGCIHKDKYADEKPHNEKQNSKPEYKRRHFSEFCVSLSIKSHHLLILFLYIILYAQSLHLTGSLDFMKFSVWHFPQICVIGCCSGGWTFFWVSIVCPHVTWRHFSLCTNKQILARHGVAKIFCFYHYDKITFPSRWNINTNLDIFTVTFVIFMQFHTVKTTKVNQVFQYDIKDPMKFSGFVYVSYGLV